MQVGCALPVTIGFVQFDGVRCLTFEERENGFRTGARGSQCADDSAAGDWVHGECGVADREPRGPLIAPAHPLAEGRENARPPNWSTGSHPPVRGLDSF